jgi:sulfatase modifying factor 1
MYNFSKIYIPVRDSEFIIRNDKDRSILLLIPDGEFIAGGDYEDKERGRFSVHLPAYYIALYPVTNGQYKMFVDETKHRPPENAFWKDIGKKNHPVVNVNWDDARDYCSWAGLRLPSELEWEKGARGIDGREFPWGNMWENGHRCLNGTNQGHDQTCNIWKFASGSSPWGLFHMAGNVWEWCEDSHDSYAYNRYQKGDFKARIGGSHHVVRGGSWCSSDSLPFRCNFRDRSKTKDRGYNGGFRCAKSL